MTMMSTLWLVCIKGSIFLADRVCVRSFETGLFFSFRHKHHLIESANFTSLPNDEKLFPSTFQPRFQPKTSQDERRSKFYDRFSHFVFILCRFLFNLSFLVSNRVHFLQNCNFPQFLILIEKQILLSWVRLGSFWCY